MPWMFFSYLGAFACGDGKVVYPVDGYDGETGHAAMLLVMPTKRTGWKAKSMWHLVVSIELGLSVGPIRQ